jgi:hypothetical protein
MTVAGRVAIRLRAGTRPEVCGGVQGEYIGSFGMSLGRDEQRHEGPEDIGGLTYTTPPVSLGREW